MGTPLWVEEVAFQDIARIDEDHFGRQLEIKSNRNVLRNFAERARAPPVRDRAAGGVLEGGGEEGGGGWVEAGGLAAIEFGADGGEIHEPALEQRPRQSLQRHVHPPVQLDLVVQRPKHRRDGLLLREGWEWHFEV